MKRFNVYFWLRRNTIYCYIQLDGTKCIDFSTGLKCIEPEWIQSDQRCIVFHIQREVEQIRRTIFDIKNYLDVVEQPYNVETLKIKYLSKSKPPALLSDVFKKFIDYKALQDIEKSTLHTYKMRLNILIRYLAHTKRSTISVNEINIRWADGFKLWLNTHYPYQDSNYANKALQMLFAVMKHAHRLELVQINTLEYLEYFPRKVKQKIYLTLDELKKLEDFHFIQGSLERVKDLFLWQCYTGMDYSTMKLFKNEFVKQSQKGLYIDGNRKKKGSRYVLPFFAPALALWNKYGGSLPIISNQKYNTYLKNVIAIAGIEKTITTHSGRKTFANYWESKGLDRRTIADMMGHKKIDTTLQHYSEVQIDGLWLKVA